MAEPNPNPTARDNAEQGEEKGEEEVLFNATRHEHNLVLFEGLPAYTCSGCKEYGANMGYKCKSSSGSKCQNFTLHAVCAALPDAIQGRHIQHPFRSDVIVKFRAKTLLRHHCSACCEVVKGFVFETERHNIRLHPLCMALPEILDYSRHANHKLRLVKGDLKGKAYSCSACDGHIACGGWRYRCEDVACKVYVDPSCAKNDIFGLPDHGIHRVASVANSTSRRKTESSSAFVQSIIKGVVTVLTDSN